MRRAMAPGIETAALSLPRGNGKSYLAATILARAMTPGHRWHQPGAELILVSGSFEQARIVYRFVREFLEPLGGFKFQDAANRIGITHKATNTRLRVISSSGKRAMGLGAGNPIIVADEPGAWETNNGGLLHAAIQGALGKPGQNTRAVYVGTLAPCAFGWWPDLIADGSYATNYVELRQGERETWDKWPTIRKANPLTSVSATFRQRLLRERDKARVDSRHKAEFLSYRLNIPSQDESTVLLEVEAWQEVLGRPVVPREGVPIVGVDLGRGRAWNAAVGLWPNGRIEAIAHAPGLPDLDAQERRDRQPAGTYRHLAELGVLHVATGLRVPKIEPLVARIREWGPRKLVCDRFELDKLRDHTRGLRVEDRVTRWSSATFDIDAVREYAKDGPLSCEAGARALLTVSLASAMVKNDDAGNSRLVKRDPANNTGRDDVAIALTLAAGAMKRVRPRPRSLFIGSTGEAA